LGSPIAAGTNSPIHDVTCPAGYLVAGGGIRSGYTTFTVMSSAPISTTTWEGEVFNTSGGPINVQLSVVCLRVSGLLSQLVSVSLPPVAPGSQSAASATCPAGYVIAGGGIASGYANFTHSVDAPAASPDRWDAVVTNHTGGVIYATVRAICLQVSGLHAQIVNADLGHGSPIAAGTNSYIVDLACPSGSLVAGGGVGVNYPDYTVMSSAPISTTTWEGEVFNTSSSAMSSQFVYATCLKRS
jgi:hypothetical protein